MSREQNWEQAMMQIWSNGGGTQSSAIAALIVQGKLPIPDFSLIVDTGYEKTATWDYLESTIQPALNAAGVVMHRVQASELRAHHLYKSGGVLMPMYSTQNGGVGMLRGFCSNEWKRRVAMRWLRAQGVKQATQWLGISIDEFDRAKPATEKWLQVRYPLIEMGLSREDCQREIARMGWAAAPKSSCYCCPYQGARQWAELRREYPADFAAAAEVEREIQRTDPHAWLTKYAVPLEDAVLDDQDELMLGCDSGACYT